MPRWQPVLDAFTRYNSVLADALTTPWRLTLAVTVYQERHPDTGEYLRDPSELDSPALGSEDRIRDHLLDAYIPVVIRAATEAGRNLAVTSPTR